MSCYFQWLRRAWGLQRDEGVDLWLRPSSKTRTKETWHFHSTWHCEKAPWRTFLLILLTVWKITDFLFCFEDLWCLQKLFLDGEAWSADHPWIMHGCIILWYSFWPLLLLISFHLCALLPGYVGGVYGQARHHSSVIHISISNDISTLKGRLQYLTQDHTNVLSKPDVEKLNVGRSGGNVSSCSFSLFFVKWRWLVWENLKHTLQPKWSIKPYSLGIFLSFLDDFLAQCYQTCSQAPTTSDL